MKFRLFDKGEIVKKIRRVGDFFGKSYADFQTALPYLKHIFASGSIVLIVLLIHKEVYSFMLNQKTYEVNLSSVTAQLTPRWAQGNSTASVRELSLPVKGMALDGNLVETVGKEIRKSPWVKEVISVRVDYPNNVKIMVKLREPAVAILKGKMYYLVDDEMIRLPGMYKEPPTLQNGALYKVAGVNSFIAPEGKAWDSDDVRTAVTMSSIVANDRLLGGLDVYQIDVSNIHGRVDRSKSEVVLQTRNGVAVEWGKVLLDDARTTEICAAEKLENLRMVLDAFPGLYGLKIVRIFYKGTPVIVERDDLQFGSGRPHAGDAPVAEERR